MSSNGVRVAAQLAADLNGTVRALPEAGGPSSFVIVLPDGRVPMLVRDHGHVLSITLTRTKAWQLPPQKVDAALIAEITAATTDWAIRAAEDTVTLLEIAMSVATLVEETLGERCSVRIPGTPDPAEIWIHVPDADKGSVGIFDGRIVVWIERECREFAVTSRAALEDARDAVLMAVREQHAAYARNVVLSIRIQTFGEELTTRLSQRLAKPCSLRSVLRPSYGAAISVTIECDGGTANTPLRRLVEIRGEGGAVQAHAGVVGSAGWDGPITNLDEVFEPIAAAVSASFVTLTIERLVVGKRYRVLESLQELEKGTVVRFSGFDDIDNHYGRYLFETGDGRSVSVSGDFSTLSRSPLGETHRYLSEQVDGW